jgi:hypothetical protein
MSTTFCVNESALACLAEPLKAPASVVLSCTCPSRMEGGWEYTRQLKVGEEATACIRLDLIPTHPSHGRTSSEETMHRRIPSR